MDNTINSNFKLDEHVRAYFLILLVKLCDWFGSPLPMPFQSHFVQTGENEFWGTLIPELLREMFKSEVHGNNLPSLLFLFLLFFRG